MSNFWGGVKSSHKNHIQYNISYIFCLSKNWKFSQEVLQVSIMVFGDEEPSLFE